MNYETLQTKLISAAKANPPSENVPYCFEKRVMAHLTGRAALDRAAIWANALWRAVAPCFAIMLLLSAWSFFTGSANGPAADLSQDFENTVFAAVDQDQPVDSTW